MALIIEYMISPDHVLYYINTQRHFPQKIYQCGICVVCNSTVLMPSIWLKLTHITQHSKIVSGMNSLTARDMPPLPSSALNRRFPWLFAWKFSQVIAKARVTANNWGGSTTKAASLGVVHHLAEHQAGNKEQQGGGGAIPELKTGDLVDWIGFQPVIHLSEKNPGGVIILLSGAWCYMEEGVRELSIEWNSESCCPLWFFFFVIIHFGFSAW